MKKMLFLKYLSIILIALLLVPVSIAHSKTISEQAQFILKNDSYDLIIITPEKFSSIAKPLVTHKNTHGIKTRIVTMEEVKEHMYWEGRDQAEKLKLFIKEAVENWSIQYVLLLGGRKDQSKTETWWVPVRYSHLDRNYGNMEEKQFLTDLYFADIYDAEGNFSSWDTNNNGIFGEWQKNSTADDIPDLYPDVSVGRLPCRNIFDVFIMVRKIIGYESRKISDTWFKTMVVVAGDTYPDKTSYFDGEVYTQMGLDIMSDFTPVKLWTSDESLQNWVDVVTTMNQGCGFIWFSGHGNPSLWGTHPPDDKQTWIYGLRVRQIPFLRNWNKLPICIDGSGCFNSMFNVSLGYSHWVHGFNVPRCWSWALTRETNGGSIATIGATAFSYESPDITIGDGGIEWLDLHFFHEYKQTNQSILGDVWAHTITSFLQNFTIDWTDTSANGYALVAKNAEQWLLIGDPSLKIGGYQ